MMGFAQRTEEVGEEGKAGEGFLDRINKINRIGKGRGI
jgi:hypothetical protein